jgi:hypothetical protein
LLLLVVGLRGPEPSILDPFSSPALTVTVSALPGGLPPRLRISLRQLSPNCRTHVSICFRVQKKFQDLEDLFL